MPTKGAKLLDAERAFYAEHMSEWTPEHSNQFVVIKDVNVLGFYSTIDDALAAGASQFGLESFLVRQVGVDEQTLTIPALTLGLFSANR